MTAVHSITKSPLKTIAHWFGWLCVLLLFSYLSFELRNFDDSLLLYLPTALSIVLIHYYGYAILPIIFANAVLSLVIWQAQGPWYRLVIIATHEPLVAFASLFLYKRFQNVSLLDRPALTDSFLKLIFFGIVIPTLLNCFYTYNYSFVNGDLQTVTLLWLSDIITILSLSLPLLYFFHPEFKGKISLMEALSLSRSEGKRPWLEFWIVIVAFMALSFFAPFGQYWFVYGIVAAVMGTRHGFETVLLINASIFLINYILPLVESTAALPAAGSTQLINVHLGNATMLFVSSLVGRVVSELKATEVDLVHQKMEIEKTNQQLKQMNQELDRFVYSVSHDLSAPLKSIQGLINLSRADSDKGAQRTYLDMMEKSANRLNDFISEVLDYSKTSRKEISKQPVNLEVLFKELQDKFIVDDTGQTANLTVTLAPGTLTTDPTLLKIALGNLLSNALKFQRKYQTEPHAVTVKSSLDNNRFTVSISDNGEGIQENHLARIFDMFYRATSNSPGSGLGLYIAREAIRKLGGDISVHSVYGEGSTFTIVLPA